MTKQHQEPSTQVKRVRVTHITLDMVREWLKTEPVTASELLQEEICPFRTDKVNHFYRKHTGFKMSPSGFTIIKRILNKLAQEEQNVNV